MNDIQSLFANWALMRVLIKIESEKFLAQKQASFENEAACKRALSRHLNKVFKVDKQRLIELESEIRGF